MTHSTQRLLSLAIDYTQEPKKTALEELKDKLSMCELCNDKATAAAFGYLLAKEEQEASDSRVENVYSEVCDIIEDYIPSSTDSTESADKIFTAIYKWLCTVSELPEDVLTEVFAETMPPLDA